MNPEQFSHEEPLVETKNNFNLTHPELKPGEVFVTNFAKGEDDGAMMQMRQKYQTYRGGEVAYTQDGKVMEDCYPAFVQQEELDNQQRQ